MSIASRPPDNYYPSVSRASGEEGTVELRLCYDARGRVIESTLATSSGFHRLDEAAVRMGRMYRITPAVIDGIARPDCVVVAAQFAASAQEAGAPPAPRYTGARMSVNFEEVPTRTLLQLIGETAGRKIVLDDSVSGSITLRSENFPWDQLLDVVLSMKGLEKRVEGDTIIVAPAGALPATSQ
jgi:TonB family protein